MPWEIARKIHVRAMRKASGRDGPSFQFLRARSNKGSGIVDVRPTKHNSKFRRTDNFPTLVEALADARRRGVVSGRKPAKMQVMIAGVTVNGRKWSAGMGCEFLLPGSGHISRVGKVSYFCLLDMERTDGDEAVFVMVKEHEVVQRKQRVYYIKKRNTGGSVCLPLHCLTYALKLVKSIGKRPDQEPQETDENYKARLLRQWPRPHDQMCALQISPTF
jgi:hypothetical protein